MTNAEKWKQSLTEDKIVDILETCCMSCPVRDNCDVVYYGDEEDEEADNKCHINILNWLRKEIDE